MRKVMTEAVTHSVYSDRKWLQFMLIRKRDRICVHPIIMRVLWYDGSVFERMVARWKY